MAAAVDDMSELVESVRSGLDAAARDVEAVIAGVGSVVATLPAGVAGAVQAELDRVHRLAVTVVVEVVEVCAYAGDPRLLRTVGRVWVDDVGGPISGLAGIATLNTTEVDDHWSGPAADAYRNTLPAQNAAFSAVAAVGDEIDAGLNDIAGAILAFWASLGAAVTTLEVAVLAARAAAATAAAAPISLATVAGGLVLFAAAALAAVVGLNNVLGATATRGAALRRRLDTDTAFPLGAWPRSTTAISTDAAVRDGDDSDWIPSR